MSATDENARHQLHLAAEESWGPDNAAFFMSALPPDRDELATSAELALTRQELRTDMAEFKTEMAEFKTEIRTEMAEFKTEIRTEMAGLRTEFADFRADMNRQMAAMTKTLGYWLVGSMATMTSLTLAAVGLAA